MLTYIEDESLFESPSQTLVNTVNTVGVMGKGVAAEFKRLYPEMYKKYRKICRDGRLDIGKLYIYRTPNKIIINFPTKKHWREKSRAEYIESGLKKFISKYSEYGISSVSFPQLGCGHGELNWENQVQPLMEFYLENLPIPVYIHLYPKQPDFIPERLDDDYAKQVEMERKRISTEELWQDLRRVILKQSEQPYSLDLFGKTIEINEEHIIFKSLSGSPKIYKEDIEDLWNLIRIKGTLSEIDVPQRIVEERATNWLFELLKRIEYIKPVSLRTKENGPLSLGLRYEPLPDETALIEAEIIV